MKRIATITAVFVALLGIFVANADEPSKERALRSWAAFVGKWRVTHPDNRTHVHTVTKTKSGAFVHEAPDLTVLVGWDAGEKNLKALGFDEDGNAFVHSWKLVGDGPKLEGTRVLGEDFSGKFTFFGKDKYEFETGDGKSVGERVK